MITKLIDYMIQKRKDILHAKCTNRYPREYVVASDIPDCDRFLVHSVLDWKERQLFNEYVQAMLDRGNTEEKQVIIDLLQMGLEIIEGQQPFEAKNKKGILCRGRIDGKIKYEGKKYPFEVKSMNINSFNGINCLEDMTKKPHHRKYLRQVQLYLFGHECEEGLIILTDLQGHYKLLPVYLDYGDCEFILQRLERAQDNILKKVYPAQMEYNEKICGKCPFNHVCLPDIKTEGASIIEDEELEGELTRRAEIKPVRDEYEELDDSIKERFRDKPDTLVGTDWRIISKTTAYKRLDTKAIPKEVKAEYEVDATKTVVSIINMKENKQ